MSDNETSASYHRSWVDDCPSGILSDCFVDRKKQRVLTQTQAAFESYNQMLGLDEENGQGNREGDGATDNTEENFINYQERNTIPLLLLLLSLLLAFLYLRR